MNKDRNEERDLKKDQVADKKSAVGTTHCGSQEVLLQTLLVKLITRDCQRTVTAIIDMGSQRSCIQKRTVIETKCQHVGSEALIQVLFGKKERKEERKKEKSPSVLSDCTSEFNMELLL